DALSVLGSVGLHYGLGRGQVEFGHDVLLRVGQQAGKAQLLGVPVMSTSTFTTASWMTSRTAATTASVSTPEPTSSASLVIAADCAASCCSVRRAMISMFRADVISAMW